jgi:hypothetical protein
VGYAQRSDYCLLLASKFSINMAENERRREVTSLYDTIERAAQIMNAADFVDEPRAEIVSRTDGFLHHVRVL